MVVVELGLRLVGYSVLNAAGQLGRFGLGIEGGCLVLLGVQLKVELFIELEWSCRASESR